MEKFDDTFNHLETIHERDGDGRTSRSELRKTPDDSKDSAYAASRGDKMVTLTAVSNTIERRDFTVMFFIFLKSPP